MILIRDLGYAYEPSRPVLAQVDLDLRRGEWVSILGTNGSGKSTLLKCIIGLLQPTTGTIKFENRPDTDPPSNPVGMVFQNPDDQIVSPVVESEIAFGLENLGVAHDEMVARVDAILDQFNLTQHRRRDPHLLSGGERQRLAIASLVIMRPNFLLFDEPTSMLDPAVRDQLFDWIRDLRDEGVTPVVVCQNPDEALTQTGFWSVHKAESLQTPRQLNSSQIQKRSNGMGFQRPRLADWPTHSDGQCPSPSPNEAS
jgi:energy-coupling factor transport system ATP-binding protein